MDGDKDLPAGLFTGTKKDRMKELVIEALEHRGKMVRDEVAIADA